VEADVDVRDVELQTAEVVDEDDHGWRGGALRPWALE
jgi:hypothetical protein